VKASVKQSLEIEVSLRLSEHCHWVMQMPSAEVPR
jgi:hypothetical protein